MNREDKEKLLLTREKMTDIFDNSNHQNMYDCQLKTAQAQLDKVLNQPWEKKPNSEGWWWLLTKDGKPVPFYYWKESKFMADIRKGKWQKVIVPEPPKEE